MSQKKKNYDNLNYKGLRRIRSILDPKYDYYEPIKTISVTNNALITNNALETSIFRKPTFSGQTPILILFYQQNIKEVYCTRCCAEHITFAPAIFRFMKILFI